MPADEQFQGHTFKLRMARTGLDLVFEVVS